MSPSIVGMSTYFVGSAPVKKVQPLCFTHQYSKDKEKRSCDTHSKNDFPEYSSSFTQTLVVVEFELEVELVELLSARRSKEKSGRPRGR